MRAEMREKIIRTCEAKIVVKGSNLTQDASMVRNLNRFF